MNNNTLDAFAGAMAAADYIAADESDFFDPDADETVAPERTTQSAQLMRYSMPKEHWIRGSFTLGGGGIVGTITATTDLSYRNTIVSGGLSDKPLVLATLWAGASVGDRIVRELGRVKDGWAGEGTAAPTRQTISDVETAVERIPVATRMPAIEIDEEDGTVALRWIAEDRSRSFSLVFRGNGRVTGVIATIDPPRSSSWSFAVSEEIQIARQFDEPMVYQLIVG